MPKRMLIQKIMKEEKMEGEDMTETKKEERCKWERRKEKLGGKNCF